MGTSRKEGSLYTRIERTLAIVEFGHPSSNCLNSELLNRLCKEFEALGENPQVSAILIPHDWVTSSMVGWAV